jgi:hypothetical protein
MLNACENPMSFMTVVHEDGSVDKTLVLEKTEKAKADENIFGIHEGNGWSVALTPAGADTANNKYRIEFSKHFDSAEQANHDLDTGSDTLFHIHSVFNKKFRWFYTYIAYSETIRPVNRFRKFSPDDFFNQEDHAFIKRLPGEGTRISKADSVFLEILNEKIKDRYANLAMFYEINDIIKQVINKNNLDERWLDTLAKNQDLVYKIIEKSRGDHNLAEQIADSLAIPLPKPKASDDFAKLTRDFDARVDFMSFANNGKYTNEVHLPWPVISSNADSVTANVAVWRPLSTKFAITEYTMKAECRKMNLWAVLVSLGIVVLTVIVFLRKPRS